MKAHIITIGNELLIGDIINTNASWIGSTLTQSGIQVDKVVTVGDDQEDINESLDQALKEADLVILTGGLGPTHDDITKKTVVDYFGSHLITHEPTLRHIKKIFEKRGLPFTKSNYGQAMVPDNAEVLFNKWGTAPGMLFRKDGHIVVVLPGVPHEMKALILDKLLPNLKESERGEGVYRVYYFQLAGIGESTLSDVVIGDIGHMLNGRMSMAYLPHIWGITLRISCYADDEKEAEQALEPVKEHIRETAAEYIYSESKDAGLGSVVGSLLRSGGTSLSTAESCTGGLLANRITDVPGSSDYFKGTVVAYDNEVKKTVLGVSKEALDQHGAVSKEVAIEMARGVAKALGTDYALSTTGIAGPGGGTPEKPVGTIWIGFWSKKEELAIKLQLTKDRLINREQTVVIALDLLRRRLNGIETLPYHLKPEFA